MGDVPFNLKYSNGPVYHSESTASIEPHASRVLPTVTDILSR